MTFPAVKNFLDFKKVLLVTYEGMCDKVDVGIDRPIKEDTVLFCKCRKRDVNTRNIYALLSLDHSTIACFAYQSIAVFRHDSELH